MTTPSTGDTRDTREILRELRRPFTSAAVQIKLNNGGGSRTDPKPGMCVCYIDARLVIERLNAIVGLDWHDEYTPLGNGLECSLTVMGVTRRDVGLPGSGPEGGTLKALYSDALKRSAVHFNVGVSVYAVPRMWVEGRDIRYGGRDGKANGITDDAMKRLRGVYADWLVQGGAAFGDPLDHGDAIDAAGDYEAAETADDHQERTTKQPDTRPVTDAQIARMHALAANNAVVVNGADGKVDTIKLHDFVAYVTRNDPGGPVTSFKALTRDQVQVVFERLEQTSSDDALAGRIADAIADFIEAFQAAGGAGEGGYPA